MKMQVKEALIISKIKQHIDAGGTTKVPCECQYECGLIPEGSATNYHACIQFGQKSETVNSLDLEYSQINIKKLLNAFKSRCNS